MVVVLVGLMLVVGAPYLFLRTWQNMYRKTPHGGAGRVFAKCVGCLIGSTAMLMSYGMVLMFVDEQLGLSQGSRSAEHVGAVGCITLFVLFRFIHWCIFNALQGRKPSAGTASPERLQELGSTEGWRALPLVSRKLGKNRAVARRARLGWTGKDD